MHLHILGVCGTFMAGIAALARELGHRVTGSDNHAWPPMSDQLAAQGIQVLSGYEAAHLKPAPDCVVIGNALSRGNPAVEHVLNEGLPYLSGPAWLSEQVLKSRWVIAVSGTHGKTTTSSMVAWILEHAGMSPGFLVGGVPQNFGISARLGESPFFVIEADEYDTAFFDKRSKLVHYPARTVIINNIEHDHTDIFHNLDAILQQFHGFLRITPGQGLVLVPDRDETVERLLAKGCWTPTETIGNGGTWRAETQRADGGIFDVHKNESVVGRVEWDLIGEHNVSNALAATAAAHHAGVPTEVACAALGTFQNVKRRLEVVGMVRGITLYDDFAHHPTAIETTLRGLRAKVGSERIIAVLEPRSNSMRMGLHRETLGESLRTADEVWILKPAGLEWDLDIVAKRHRGRCHLKDDIDAIITDVSSAARPGDHILIMSNGDFGGIHKTLLGRLTDER